MRQRHHQSQNSPFDSHKEKVQEETLCITRDLLCITKEEVAEEFVMYYQGLLGSAIASAPVDPSIFSFGPTLQAQQLTNAELLPSDSEIQKVLFSIGDDKSPGPDGYSSCFFKSSWQTVGHDVCAAVKEFFSSGRLLRQLNHTIITLLPKSAHSSSVGEFRPIACCSVLYKVITKLLAARLAPLLPLLINEAQSAFIEGRSMIETVHLAQELIRQYNRKRSSPRVLIKVDLQKAYDSVDWDFLNSVLIGFGFPSMLRTWIMECVTTPSYSVKINGNIHGFFQGRRGLRQGDPLSPYLFILCMEYLSGLLRRGTEGTEFNFHPRCEALQLSHLAYADDLMFFCRGDISSVRILIDCLQCFGDCSGLYANPQKSCIFTAGIHGPDKDALIAATGVSPGCLPVRYLGVPLAAEALKVVHYAPLLQKIAEQIGVWTASSLSFAGRLELIRSVIQGINCF